MEFFLPSLFLFLLVAVVVIGFMPKLSPLILMVLSAVLLVFGVYNHYTLFKDEYRLSTWQEGLKSFAPGIMIAAIIIFILYFIASMFTGGEVPVPSIPNVTVRNMPPAETATNFVTSTLNNVTSAVANTASAVSNATTNILKNNGLVSSSNTVSNVNKNGRNVNKSNNNLSRSFLEVL